MAHHPEGILVGPIAPEKILGLGAPDADRLLDRLDAEVPVHPGAVTLPDRIAREAILFGDTHGDWRSMENIASIFLANPQEYLLIGLGDYIDRPPEDCPNGSVANALFLLGLAARFPDRVFLLKGNHEANRRIPVLPHSLPEEVDDLWGPEVDRYSRILGLLERGPWVATSGSGLYLAHGGFPTGTPGADWRSSYQSPSDELLYDTVWRDASQSRHDRGLSPPFRERDLIAFLEQIDAKVFVRGHDPDLAGRIVDGHRCLTLHSTRVYEQYGGVLYARARLDRPLLSADDLTILHTETEGRSFDEDVA
jgi:protein phosphatase